MTSRWTCKTMFVLAANAYLFAQQPPPAGGVPQNPPGVPAQGQPQPTRELPADSIRPNYVLGPNDQILVRAPQAEEINERPFRIDAEGFINLPLVGRVRAGGLTVQELEAELVKRLRELPGRLDWVPKPGQLYGFTSLLPRVPVLSTCFGTLLLWGASNMINVIDCLCESCRRVVCRF